MVYKIKYYSKSSTIWIELGLITIRGITVTEGKYGLFLGMPNHVLNCGTRIKNADVENYLQELILKELKQIDLSKDHRFELNVTEEDFNKYLKRMCGR